jgi:S1-C subfamily serine protease
MKVRRNRFLWTAAWLASYSLHTFAADWAALVKPTEHQVLRLESQKDGDDTPGVCSSVVIATQFVVTAAHCIPAGDPKSFSITVDGRHAESVKVNRLLDLAVVKFKNHGAVAMLLADDSPPAGTDVAIVGFGFGIDHLAAQFGRVSQPQNRETKMMFVNADILPGDSGGAVMDAQGRLVGVNSRIYYIGPSHMAAAVPVEVIADFIESAIKP